MQSTVATLGEKVWYKQIREQKERKDKIESRRAPEMERGPHQEASAKPARPDPNRGQLMIPIRYRFDTADRTLHRTHMTRHRRTFSRVSAHVTVGHHLPTTHRWLKIEVSIQFCISQKSSCRHMFRRNMFGVLDPFLSFLSTSPLTQPSLQTAIGFTRADPRSGKLFGRMAEQCTLTGCEPKSIIEVDRLNRVPSQVMSPRT